MQTKRLMDKAPLLKERYWSNCHTDEDFELLIFIQRFLSSVSLIFILFFFLNVGTAPVNILESGARYGNWNTLGVPLSKGINKPG